jgi:hypothetical protein
MDDPLIDEEAIRSYLLGRIRAEDELSAQFDERMLGDPEFSLLMDAIEDDILEEYVEGALTAADVEALQSHFLLPPERQRKLHRIRLISKRLAGAAEKGTLPTESKARAGSPERGRVVAFPSVRTWAEIAAGLALMSCTIYFWTQQHELRSAVKQSGQEPVQSKQAQLGGPPTAMQAGVVTLNLFVPGLSRGDQALPEAHLTAGVATLHLSVALTAPPAGRISVQLKQGDAVIWFRDGVETRAVTGGAVFVVDLPTAVVSEGPCRLMVSVPGEGETSYWFKATKAH